MRPKYRCFLRLSAKREHIDTDNFKEKEVRYLPWSVEQGTIDVKRNRKDIPNLRAKYGQLKYYCKIVTNLIPGAK